MARHKEFDQNQVINKAMDLFWSRGYEATSVQDLVDHVGIGRGSLYDTFGDKRSLYLNALERYQERSGVALFELFEQTDSAKVALKQFFEAQIDAAVADPAQRGCFVVNTAVELAPHDPEIAGKVQAAFGKTEDAFYRLIAKGQATGEIVSTHDARCLARFLLNTLMGLRVMAKAKLGRKALEDSVKIALSSL
ncbi:MAG: TetR/AcrR family transcriptional regulator [Chloroflexi bacterium AL-W]|nr:TetR/AcrR family transcriptional regulator [Chloroflexi bacterium AL-N1]NOK67977.1 TetR/AcrR family transcriptional regulator [Chloroflexi bacterium AL-N10]NOK73317.1 TetR/AcrR family transcriptional regulator [Chloroflexi bacterium AL-N5]NOK83231.1 TetR/AcrR family transcriptional regulator [Chloroflexi bacterium AL-W]NOK87648.1 TetR/AcrR family transcriptional regulator [Chloroflexi bacterium AL-N15]